MSLSTKASFLAVLVCLVGCLDEQRQVGDGEACRGTAECAPGFICVEQVCSEPLREQRAQRPDSSFADGSTEPGRDVPTSDLPPGVDTDRPTVDTDRPGEDTSRPDLPPQTICVEGERDCQDNATIRVCIDDGLRYALRNCADGTICQRGTCVAQQICEDRDGDGVPAGDGCPGPIDCNDSNPTVLPGVGELCDGLDNNCNNQIDESLSRSCRTGCGFGVEECLAGGVWSACSAGTPEPEICDNGEDDDCDGRIDEGCAQCCEPGSCPDGSLCVECSCEEAPEDECRFQNQPCDPNRAGQNGDFACFDFSGGRDGLCFGLCSFQAPNPNATCPTEDAICAFAIDDFQGLCLDGCDPSTNTGCFGGQGCLVLQSGGGCVPVGDTPEEGQCDAFGNPFGQCESGTACLEVDEFGGSCQRFCNPTGGIDGETSFCRDNTSCFPLGDGFGLCFPSLEQETGTTCNRFDAGRPCNDSAVCERSNNGEAMCRQLCRRNNGNEDCPGDLDCRRSNALQDNTLGTCR